MSGTSPVSLPRTSASSSSGPPLNFLTVQVTPLASAQALHSGSMAFAVLAELSAQTTRVESPPAAAEEDPPPSLSFGAPDGLDESSPPQAVSTTARTLSATPALSVRPLVLRICILHLCAWRHELEGAIPVRGPDH